MISDHELRRQLKDALANYHAPVHLQTHPLTKALAPADGGDLGAQGLRRALREAIESLRPSDRIPFGQPEWLGYRALWLRYVEAMSVDDVCAELATSRATFYRVHREALVAVTSLVRARITLEVSDVDASAGAGDHDRALRQISRIMDSAHMEPVSLETVVVQAVDLVAPVAREQAVDIRVQALTTVPLVQANRSLLRQAILSVLTATLREVEERELGLSIRAESDSVLIQLDGLGSDDETAARLLASPGFEVAKRLLEAHGGGLAFTGEWGCEGHLCLAVPVIRRRTIVALDDDGDTISLYDRYLHGTEFRLVAARNGSELSKGIAEGAELVLLDVLMPDEDGWDILRQLQDSPETRDLPVVVCSVLTQPRLALALGAAEVLQKPIPRETLLQTARRLLGTGNGP